METENAHGDGRNVNVNGKSVKIAQFLGENYKNVTETLKNFSQMFQIPGLRKMNIANIKSIFDLNECDIQILR